MSNSPAQLSPRVAELLQKTRAARGRLIFALDATGSREAMWDLAIQNQAAMFTEAAKIGGLAMQVAFYHADKFKASPWLTDVAALVGLMRTVKCVGGATQIARTLRHVRAEHAREKVDVAVFVGDACEERPAELFAEAVGLPPMFMFAEGAGLVIHPDTDTAGFRMGEPPWQTVEQVFREIARLSGGAYGTFGPGAAQQLSDLLRAVAAFATGGLKALANQNSDAARKLLGQMKHGA